MYKLKVITSPFTLIGLPSFEVASLKAFLLEKNIDVSIEHVYIKFADYIGGDAYKILRITDVGENIFSSLLFPELYEKNKQASNKTLAEFNLSFDNLYKTINDFTNSYIENILVEKNEIVLFYMYTQQLLPSLYFAKLIKEKFKCPIWFGGYNCKEKMGESLLASFDFIDKVFAEEIEESIFYAINPDAKQETHDTLDFLPTPDYSDFFTEVKKCSKKFQNERATLCFLQVEFSRGCWWNKCSFCTLNCNTNGFREKSLKNIINDYRVLQKKHNTTKIVVQLFVNNLNWQEILRCLSKRFPGLKNAYNFNFKISSLLDPKDFDLLKETGTSILVGTESFSLEYLKLLNKGQTVIENIQVLKFAERKGIPCYHNLMYALPFEKEEFYEESKENISYIYHLPPPFDNEEFRLTYESPIFNNLEKYKVKSMDFRKEKEASFFPDNIKRTFTPFFYDFESEYDGIEERKCKWVELIKNWRTIYYGHAIHGQPKHLSLLYMNYNEQVLQICDARYDINQNMYTLSEYERKMYEFCDQIRSIKDIVLEFQDLSPSKIQGILNYFVKLKIMFCENDRYLSLAI